MEAPERPRAENDLDEARSSLIRKIAVGAAGTAVTGIGLVMLVTPGPGLIVTAGGLAILASEFKGARRILDRIKRRIDDRRSS